MERYFVNWISKVSNHLAAVVRRNTPEMTDEKYEIIRYGLYVLISDVTKFLVTMILAWVLGILFYSIVTIFSFGAIRYFMGGVHAKTWWGCLGANLLLFLGIPYVALYFTEAPTWPVSGGTFIISSVIIHFYAPADHENKPVVSGFHRQRLKMMAYLVLILMFIIATFMAGQPVSNIIMFSVLGEAILVLPPVYKLTRTKYGRACEIDNE